MEETPARLRRFEDLVIAAFQSNMSADELALGIRDILPASGHPNGHWMANLIEAEPGRERLVRGVHDPFVFVREYPAAAQTAGEFSFSSKFLDRLSAMEHNLARCPSGQ